MVNFNSRLKDTRLHKFLLIGLFFSLVASCSGEKIDNGQVFRMPISNEPPTLDWSLATDSVSFDILTNIMEGLTQYDSNMEPVPAIAKRWEISKNGKMITYYLRDDVFWTDGKPVTAHDFEYSWKRLLNPATAAQYAYFLFDIENAQEFNSGKISDPSKVGVSAKTAHILEVRLKKPVVYFPSITTFMVTFPQRKDIVEKFGDHWTDPENIVTNGPFKLSAWEHEYKLILTANENFYEGRPPLDTILAYVIREKTTALTLYETGELEMVELPPVAIPHFKNHDEYENLPQLRGYYYGINVLKPPFNNPLVRRAFAHSIDRSRLPLLLKGEEIPSSSWIPKGMFGYNPDIGAKFDPVTGQKLLAKAGYPKGEGFPEIIAMYNTNDTNRLIGEFLQAQWKEHLNVNIQLESQEWKVFLNRLQVDPPQVFRLGWGADFPDPDNFMNLFISSSGNNRLRWSNSRYDELVALGATLIDPKERQLIYDEAQRILTETDAAMIPLFVATQNLLIKPYVKGFEMNSMELMYLKKVHITIDPTT
ncbi:MAG: peptide ABC transporter substrate-binding protein [Deltaproteobacteria bacterium]|nr:peptide ABC transporter substrate-binding protein [Deltaproteobacteria bacterium]